MFRMFVPIAAVGLVGATECRAQFVDNFDGEALAPHWEIGAQPSHLEHTVGGGLLTVTGLPYPSGKHSPTNNAIMLTTFPTISGNFYGRAVVGWAPGEQRSIGFGLSTLQTFDLGSIAYVERDSSGPAIRVNNMFFAAPPPGMHEFALQRIGGTMHAFLNGQLLVSYPAATLDPVGRIGMRYSVEYPNNGMQPLYVDFIQVVPSPGAFLVLGFSLFWAKRRRL